MCVTLDPTTAGGFTAWCQAMARPELAEDGRFATPIARARHRGELDEELAAWVATFHSAAELEAALGVSSVLAAEVRSVAELAETPWAQERGAFVDVELGHGPMVQVPQAPWRFSQAEAGVRPTAGFRGEHNRAVLRELAGVDDAELDGLVDAGVVSDRVPEWRR